MKNTFFILSLIVSQTAISQVIFGDAIGTVPAGQKSSVLLEFAAGQNKGLILPYVRSLPSGNGLVEGTIVLDATNITDAKIKYYNGVVSGGGSDGWFDLSNGRGSDLSVPLSVQPSASQVTENTLSKVIIGAGQSSADGVLVLESDSKALVLPIVASTNDVIDPAPGMMVYLNRTGAKRLAVYNGNVWTYWKP